MSGLFYTGVTTWTSDRTAGLKETKPPLEPPQGNGTFQKSDTGKSRVDLISPSFLEELGHVLRIGGEKYGDDNALKGTSWRRYIGATLRHVYAFMRGKDIDDGPGGTGYSHLACATASLMFLFEYVRSGLGTDDRYKR